MEFLTKGREVKPLILKLSIVIAFSFPVFLLSQFRSWRIRPAVKEESHDKNKDTDLEKINKGITRSTSASPSATSSSITSINNTATEPSTKNKCRLNEEAMFDLPDRNHKSASKILNTTKDKEVTSVDEQILQLTNMIVSLQERERSLEQQLSKYQGMREQENMIRELESKIKICKVEAKIYNMKIETLKIDNQRLQANEEDSKTKIKTLKKKLKEVEDENGILVGLHRKVSILHEDKLRKLIDQENKVATLQKKNSELLSENSELLKKLELALEKSSEAEEALKEVECLKLANEELSTDIETHKLNSSKDNEELVYLRWVNACLRYELRNFNPSSGKSAKDLDNNLSQESKDKAKNLILDYAISISENDQEYPCNLLDEAWANSKPTTPSSTTGRQKNQSKGPEFFNKLAKFMLKKKSHNHEEIDGSEEMLRSSSGSLEEILSSRGSYKQSSSSGSNTTPVQEVDVIDSIKRKRLEELAAQRRALECEKADLRSFANQLNRSKALQLYCKKTTSFSN
ncbi:uncharacterized protein LOC144563896 [Carex rostrata]